MDVLHCLQPLNGAKQPIAITLGMFDGVHLGHQALLEQLKSISQGGTPVVLTYQNHPSTTLRPQNPTKLILPIEQRLNLLNELGIQTTYLLNFTEEFANQTADEFLRMLHQQIPFSFLVLGHDARIGKNKEAGPEEIQKMADELAFSVIQVPPYIQDGAVVSSSRLRKALQQGYLEEVVKLLGRPYSIAGPVIGGKETGRKIGFRTANINVDSLCLPPLGVYAVWVKHQDNIYKGVVNLGFAPTVKNDSSPVLEVHLLESDQNLYGEVIEVIFVKFLREEIKFETIDLLKTQIEKDIQQAITVLKKF